MSAVQWTCGVVACAVLAPLLLPATAAAQQTAPSPWSLEYRLELRANIRNSSEEVFPIRFPFPPESLPPGQTVGIMETPDPGTHAELSVAQLQLDLNYGRWFMARAKVHAVDLHRRNPTSTDRTFDADELFIRFGPKPEFLDRPEGTSLFLQLGKAPKMERQPTRLLESYGLASNSFNRFEDVQALLGGTLGRNLYWRLQLSNGNPLFIRDSNALAGDNGTEALLRRERPRYGSGFPILYNAEVEDLVFNDDNTQFGQGLGYRWQRDDGSAGFDAILFHYRRDLADEVDLTGTFYGGDLDILSAGGLGFPLQGRKKQEMGGRVYGEWRSATAIVQYTKQNVAGLFREGWEGEIGYRFELGMGPLLSIQPAARLSGLKNRFVPLDRRYPAPSVFWSWSKIDAGLRIAFARGVDLTIEHAKHNVGAPRKLDLDETLATVRWRYAGRR